MYIRLWSKFSQLIYNNYNKCGFLWKFDISVQGRFITLIDIFPLIILEIKERIIDPVTVFDVFWLVLLFREKKDFIIALYGQIFNT